MRAKVLKHLPGTREGGAKERSWEVGVIKRKEVRGDGPIEYFLGKSKVASESEKGDGS